MRTLAKIMMWDVSESQGHMGACAEVIGVPEKATKSFRGAPARLFGLSFFGGLRGFKV